MTEQAFIPPHKQLPEMTLKVIVLGIILTVILAISNTYLALKIGILTSASIPAAILSMGVLRFFRNSNILENNLVQTAASAGEAIAGGIVYTIPALIIIHYWAHFPYWVNVAIALIGGLLGVMYTIPLRRVLVTQKALKFPEGRAIAEVLKAGSKQQQGIELMFWGGLVGALIQFCQTGLKVIADSVHWWFASGKALFGFSAGFSATLIGAGYLMGFEVAASLLIGAVIGWIIGVPTLSELYPMLTQGGAASDMVMSLWDSKIRYIGIGAMIVASLWTLATLAKPFIINLMGSFKHVWPRHLNKEIDAVLRSERDVPIQFVLIGILLLGIGLYGLFDVTFPVSEFGLGSYWQIPFILTAVLYALFVGLVLSAITGYFSGLVGVSATPGSAIVISGLIFAALVLRSLLNLDALGPENQQMVLNATAVTIMIGSIITGAAAIANDNIQDLKVGHIIGATPWKQQVMLILGVVVSALVIPPVMELLFNAYGIAGVFPRPNMDPSQMLTAPPASLMAAVSQGVLNRVLPWDMIAVGAVIASACIVLQHLLQKKGYSLSVIGIAIGIYLPLSSSTPLFLGGFFALLAKKSLVKRTKGHSAAPRLMKEGMQRGMLVACGLVAGAALMDVFLAIPFAVAKNPDVLRVMPTQLSALSDILGVLTVLALGYWIFHAVCRAPREKE